MSRPISPRDRPPSLRRTQVLSRVSPASTLLNASPSLPWLLLSVTMTSSRGPSGRVARNVQVVEDEGTPRDCEFTFDFVRRYGLHTILIGDLTDAAGASLIIVSHQMVRFSEGESGSSMRFLLTFRTSSAFTSLWTLGGPVSRRRREAEAEIAERLQDSRHAIEKG